MAHDHAHDPKSYFVEQLCTIAVSGALGGIALMLWKRNLLWFLAPKVQPWVMAGGVILLVLVAVRAWVVWFQAGKVGSHDHAHDHEHGHSHGGDCGHDHGHSHGETCAHDHHHEHGEACDHDHEQEHAHLHGGGDGHDHGWAPWRYVILLLPIVLYFLDMPNELWAGADNRDKTTLSDRDLHINEDLKPSDDKPFEVDFPELQRAANNRQAYEGKTIRVKGEYLPGNERLFTLVRYKMSCCARDAIPLKAVIMLDPKSSEELPTAALTQTRNERKWLTVEGQVQFQPDPADPESWVTIIVLRPGASHPLFDPSGQNENALIRPVPPEKTYYLN